MLKQQELGRKLGKADYEAQVPGLRTRLLKAQAQLEAAGFPLIVLIHGADGAGKSETANTLNAWLDARYLVTRAYEPPSEDERERPEFWRYWMWLPPAGRVGLFLGSWYTQPIIERAFGRIGARQMLRAMDRINAFERTLSDEGALFVKLWFHVSEREQQRKFEKLERSKQTRYRVTKNEWRNHERYSEFVAATEEALRQTSSGTAPWTVIESGDERYRNVAAAEAILERLEHRLSMTNPASSTPPQADVPDPVTLLDKLDLTLKLDKKEYEDRLFELEAELGRLARKLQKKQRSAIIALEGWDAAGKGGAIRRLIWGLDARQYQVISVSAPSDEERAHHYLWRFWRHLPKRGRITIYDRTWYGRVLVERVEGFAREEQWRRAYSEINDFERELIGDGTILIKFWLHISREEQLKRFQEREQEPWKQHKIGAEDYRNRAKSNLYEAVASEMIARNSTLEAPFTLVEAENKHYARIKVLETVCRRLADELD
jgi:polyphosphate:AMP phosphotransferase